MIDTQAPPSSTAYGAPKLRRFEISSGKESRKAIIAVSTHAPVGRASTRAVPRTEAQIRTRAEALAREYFGVKWPIKVTPIDEVDV